MKKIILLGILLILISTAAFGIEGKTVFHFVTLPLVEASGIYTSVKAIYSSDHPNTRAAAISNISLLAASATVGVITYFIPVKEYVRWQRFHKVLAFATSLASVWMAVSLTADDNIHNIDRGISYGYAAAAQIPLFAFSF